MPEVRQGDHSRRNRLTAMKVHWLSKIDVAKKVGSLVIWLKNKLAADYLLGSGTAIFGATGACCSYQQRPKGGRSSANVLSHREIQPLSSEPFRGTAKEVGRAGAKRLSGEDLPSVEELQDLDTDIIRREGSV